MKTQIIQLNNNDDYLSVSDKMGWCQTGRILLVWPNAGTILDRKLDLNLIKRHAIRLGAQLAFVTWDSKIRSFANEIGIPVFTDLLRAQNTDWKVDGYKEFEHIRRDTKTNFDAIRYSFLPNSKRWVDHPITRIIFFGIGVLALIALGIFTLPGATIILTPDVVIQSMTFQLTANSELTTVNLATSSLPTEAITVTVEGSEYMVTTGEVIIPDQAAKCELLFTNISDHDLVIPTGTIVSTSSNNPIHFATSSKDEVIIEPGSSIIVEAHAIEPGTSGNLPPDSLVAIEGDLGLDLIVTNLDSSNGGSDASVPAPSADDLTSLQESLHKKLEQVALLQVQSNLSPEDTLISSGLKSVEVLEKNYFPEIGEPGKQLSLTMRIRFHSEMVTSEVLHSLVEPIMDANIKAGYLPDSMTMLLRRLSNPTLGEDGHAHWTVRAERKLHAEIPSSKYIDQIKGLSISEALEHLERSLPLAEQVQIKLTPNWWPRLPYLAMRMHFDYSESR